MGKTALLAVGGGGLSGAALLAALAGSPWGVVTAYMAPLPLLAAGFALGAGGFGFAAAAGLAITLAFGGPTGAGLYGGMHVLPSWLIVQQALRTDATAADGWQPVGKVLAGITVLVALLVAVTIWFSRGEGGVEATMQAMLTTVMGLAAPALDDADRAALVGRLAPLFPGFSGAVWLATLVGNAVAAQGLLASRGWARRPRPRWSELQVPGWLDWVLVATAVAGLVFSGDAAYLARNGVVVLLTPYFLVGLAVVHVAARRSTLRGPLLAGFYVVVMVFFLVAVALVAALGVAEQWVGIRRRLPATPPRD